MDSEPRKRVRGISAKALSSYGYAVCLFPEQPQQQIVVEQEEAVIPKTVVKKVEAATYTPRYTNLVRLYWRNRLVYIIAFISYSLSLNNVYYFPINIYRFGSTFFIPYTVATVIIGYPLHVLETSMGQYAQRGALWVWGCAPIFCGVGVAMIIVCLLLSLYHTIFAAYALIYFAHCFNSILPWTYCHDFSWSEDILCAPSSWLMSENISLSSKEYFYNVILNTPYRYPSDSSPWELGSLKWWLFLSVLFSCFIIYVATLRSARSIGKIAIIIVIFSYFAILALLIVAFQIKNTGKLVLSENEDSNIFNIDMWCAATMQVLLELGLCFGIPVVYGSYCRFRNFLHIDSIILCLVNYLNSLIFFYLFFSFFSSFSCNIDKIKWDIPDRTIGVVYMIYSEAIANLSGSNIWCILFFFMLFCIIIGTQIAVTETVMTAIYDNFTNLSRFRWLFNILICGFFSIFGIFFCFTYGYYDAIIFDYILIFAIIVPLTLLFLVGIIFVYGLNNYFRDMKTMLDYDLKLIVKVFLYFLAVLLIVMLLVLGVFVHSTILTEGNFSNIVHYVVAGAIIVLCPLIIGGIIWIVLCKVAHKKIYNSTNTWERLQEEKKNESGQFVKYYLPYSYTWEWNKY